MKILVKNTLNRAVKIRDKTSLVRIKSTNVLRTQNDIIEYAQRSRIHDTEKCKIELEWQKSTVCKTMQVGKRFDFNKKNCGELYLLDDGRQGEVVYRN